MARVDVEELRDKVKVMYRAVAEEPQGEFHFEMGRRLAERLGYPAPNWTDARRKRSSRSPASVTTLDWPRSRGERVVDLGSGSGMDAFLAAHQAGPAGSRRCRHDRRATRQGACASPNATVHASVRFEKGYIEEAPVPDGSVDVVISNGVINLCDDKAGGLSRDRPDVETRRPDGDLRHRHRAPTDRSDRLRRQPLGVVHRWRDAAGRLPACHRARPGSSFARCKTIRSTTSSPTPRRERPRRSA